MSHPPAPPGDYAAMRRRLASAEATATETALSLTASKVRYRALFDHAAVSLWEEDFSEVKRYLDGLETADLAELLRDDPEAVRQAAVRVDLLDVNPATVALLEAPDKAEVLAGLHCHFNAKSLEVFREELIAFVGGAERFDGEASITTFNGREIEVAISAVMVPGHAADWSRLVVSLVDISGHRRAERQTRRIARLLATTLDGYILADDKGGILEVNDAYCRMIGYPREALVEMNIRDLEATWSPEEIEGRIAEIVAAGSARFETRHRRADGSEIDLDVSTTLFFDEEEPLVAAFCRDVTEQRRARAALEASEQRYRRLMEQANDAIFLADAESGLLLDANDRALALVGRSRDELIGQPQTCLHPTDDQAKYRDTFHRHAAAGRAVGDINHVLHKDGRHIPVEISAATIDLPEGRIVQGIFRDLSHRRQAAEERRHLERQLRQAQKMETIGTLAGGIAHDFNNLLQAILGYADLGVEDTEEGSRARRDVERILTAGHRAKELVRQILTFSRQAEGERRPVQLHPIIKEAIKLLRASIPAAIEIRENIATTCPPVLADLTQIHQVVMNLATNACHAMREQGGTLEVGLAMVEVEAVIAARHPGLKPGRHVRLTVSDTGHGMTPQTVERIFDPFFTTKGVDEGTGLGLSVVHGIVTTHGGAVVVESTPGGGTTFDVYLPAVDLAQVPETTEAPAAIPGHERILYVDDDHEISTLTHEMLSRLGYQVARCHDPTTALATFRGRPNDFDLLLTDQSMGRMDGVHLVGECHAIRPDLPAILMTGFSDKGVTKLLDEHVIAALIQKPILIRELSRELRRVLDGPPTDTERAPDNGTNPNH